MKTEARAGPHPAVVLFIIARATFLIALRGRLLAGVAVIGLLLAIAGLLGAQLNRMMLTRMTVDLGLAAASTVGSFVAGTLALRTYHDELSGRQAEPLLARPIGRSLILLGKASGIFAVSATYIALIAAMTALCISLTHGAMGPAFWPAWALVVAEAGVTTSLSFLIATQASQGVAASLLGALWLVGHLSDDLLTLAQSPPTALGRHGLTAIFYLVPDYARLSLRAAAGNALEVPAGLVPSALLYAALYMATCLSLGAWAYARPRQIA